MITSKYFLVGILIIGKILRFPHMFFYVKHNTTKICEKLESVQFDQSLELKY